jgi:protein-S-isoprenylcysteine O-methyltransferase Ste14
MKSLAAKALIGFASRMVFYSIFIFVPAWTVNYWQGWVVLGVFGVIQLPMVIYFLKSDPELVERRLKCGSKAESRPRQKVVMAMIMLAAASVCVTAGYDHRLGWSEVPFWLVIFADCGIAIGLFIQFLIFKENSFASATIRIMREQRVISTGPYAVVRHPMYAGGVLVNFMLPMALGSWWALWASFLWLAAVILRVLDEEKLLREGLAGYEDYCGRVRDRLVPGVW